MKLINLIFLNGLEARLANNSGYCRDSCSTDQCIQTSYLPPTISLFNFVSLDVEVHQEKGTEYQDMNADWTTPLEKMRHRAGDSNLIMMMMFVLTGGDLNNSVRLSVCD